jgi:hypothetical protein
VTTLPSLRRVSLAALTSLAVLLALASLFGCGSPAATSGPGSASTSASSSASAQGASKSLTFDLAASQSGRPRTWAESTITASWFPPAGVDGLRTQLDAKQIAALTRAISGNEQFWIERLSDHTKPITFGSDARSLLATSTGFSAATIVPVYNIKSVSGGAAVLAPSPTGYEVLLTGDVGSTSFGVRPGPARGVWLLDPNGELVNWSGAIDAIGRKTDFTSTSASVVHATFDLGGKPALYLSWAVFRDSKGRRQIVALHSPPQIKATWTVGNNEPLQLGRVYDFATITSPVTITATR